MREKFTIYVRTLMFLQYRLKDKDVMSHVFISMENIKRRFFATNTEGELQTLAANGEISRIQKVTTKGHTLNMFKCLRPGTIDLTLIEPKGKELNRVHSSMMGYLQFASLPDNAPRTKYFEAFLLYRNIVPRLFFTVDEFSGRVHTPVTSFHKEYRDNILLMGEKTTSLDVATMQPLLLGKILKNEIGKNDFSEWLDNGEDVYLMLQNKANLSTRDEAKKMFFQILFSKPNNRLVETFGASNWIEWINQFKQKPLLSNPHTIEKEYSNLAWLLQNTEVKLMFKVWYNLVNFNIPFLSVHDEIIIRESDFNKANEVFQTVLSHEFTFFKLNGRKPEIKMPVEVTKVTHEKTFIFSQPENSEVKNLTKLDIENLTKPHIEQSEDWSDQIKELVSYFSNTSIPTNPIKLDVCSTITNTKLFIESHIATVRANNGNKTFLPYLNRLETLRAMFDT